jgi:hypothetical protein
MRLKIAVTIAMLNAGGALAQDEPAIPPQVLEVFPMGEDRCYRTHFEPHDMKPKQKLTDFYLYRLFDPNPAKEEVELTRAEAIAFDMKGNNANWTDVIARFSDKPHLYSQSVTCNVYETDSGQMRCGVECDGGSFIANREGSGMQVAFASEYGGLSLNQSCGEPDDEGSGRWMTAEEAGSGFSLDKAPIAECQAVDRDAHPAFAEDPMPLRERVAVSGWRCLKRQYDKAHMAKHPRQAVTAMAVALRGAVTVDTSQEGYPQTSLDVRLSFKTRDGKLVSKDVQCGALEYEFVCEGNFRLRRRDDTSALLLAGEFEEEGDPLPRVLDTELGRDDKIFRLDASREADCRVD